MKIGVKSLIGREDIQWFNGKDTSFTRKTAMGGKIILHPIGEVVYPETFGAVGDGVADDSQAIQDAINNITTGIVQFRTGTYRITKTITIKNSRIKLKGCGPQSTKLYFDPASAIPMLDFYTGTTTVLYQNGLEDLTCYNNAYAGSVAVRLTDTSEFLWRRVAIYPWTGVGSIGLQLRGKDLMVFDNISISATLPISIEDNPNSTIDLDQCIFRDSYLIAGADQPCVNVADGVNITNLNFEGRNAWVPSNTHAFYWSDTASASASANLNFKNIRIEQETLATSYMFYISLNTSLNNLSFENVYGGLTQKGFYLRAINNVSFQNCFYVGVTSNEVMNVDATVYHIVLLGCYWQAGTTATMTGQSIVFGTGKVAPTGALPGTGVYTIASQVKALAIEVMATYDDNAAAKVGGLTDGQLYRTATGVVMVVYT